MRTTTFLVLITALTACGESTSVSDTGSDTSTTDTGGSDTASDTGTAPVCPTEVPDDASACAPDGLICEFGMPSCLSSAECIAGQWEVAVRRCPPPPAGGCPATRADADGAECPGDDGAQCDYEGGLVCRCTTCPNPFPICMEVDPPVWACEAPNPDDECPAGQPNLGTRCANEGKECDYGCEAGERRICAEGIWTPGSQPGGCPMSTRRAKRDIDYLNESEVENLAAAVRSTRLASYEYIDPALDGRRRLGFIIEDQPSSYSVDPERSQVDLYGYTSMLVAAIQSQERRIQRLEAQLEAATATP